MLKENSLTLLVKVRVLFPALAVVPLMRVGVGAGIKFILMALGKKLAE